MCLLPTGNYTCVEICVENHWILLCWKGCGSNGHNTLSLLEVHPWQSVMLIMWKKRTENRMLLKSLSLLSQASAYGNKYFLPLSDELNQFLLKGDQKDKKFLNANWKRKRLEISKRLSFIQQTPGWTTARSATTGSNQLSRPEFGQ